MSGTGGGKAAGTGVAVPRLLLAVLVLSLGFCVVALAYLLGRESARNGSLAVPRAALPSSAPSTAVASPPAPPERVPEPVRDAEREQSPSVPVGERSTPARPSPREEPPGNSTPAPVSRDPLADDVALYFRESESIQSGGKYWTDPQALASTILDQASRGESGEFDRLIENNRKVLSRLQGLKVPLPCREHHRLTTTLLGESISLLVSVKESAVSMNVDSLANLPAAAQGLETRAKQADTLASDIKRRFGLAP